MEERLQKVLARAGVASRRKAEELILEGRVSVNGRAVRELGTKVDTDLDEISVDTVRLPRTAAAGDAPRTYLLLYKPNGVLCTVKDTHGRPTVLDIVPPFPGKRLYPVGRLDEDSEGLVLLTNDGELTARLTHPRYGVPKVYEVRLKGHVTHEDAQKYERGVWLSEGRTGRSRLAIERAGRETSHVRVTLTEGRNREIRRAWAKLGFDVLSIKRIQIGPVVGRGLSAGQYRPLAADEVEALHASAQGSDTNEPMRRVGSREHGPRTESGEDRPRRRRGGKPDPARLAKEFKAKGGDGPWHGRPGGRSGTRGHRADRPGTGRPPTGRPGSGRPSGGRPAADRGPGDRRPFGGGPGRGPGLGRGTGGPGRGPGFGRGPGGPSRGPGGPGRGTGGPGRGSGGPRRPGGGPRRGGDR